MDRRWSWADVLVRTRKERRYPVRVRGSSLAGVSETSLQRGESLALPDGYELKVANLE